MDKLPPELVLKIAGYCDFAEVCAMSKLNRRWKELIDSNWHSFKKIQVESVCLDEELDRQVDETVIQCTLWEKANRRKVAYFKIVNGSENVEACDILEKGWIIQENFSKYHFHPEQSRRYPQELSTRDVGNLREDFLTPLFRPSKINELTLDYLKLSSLQLVIALLERYRTPINTLFLVIGSRDSISAHNQLDVQELELSARIVELAKPRDLVFRVVDSFTKEEICEHFLGKIANLFIPYVTSSYADFSARDRESGRKRTRPMGHGPFPKCFFLSCEGDPRDGFLALAVPDMVDLVEEWSTNAREIVEYEFYLYNEEIAEVAAKFELELSDRNLPIQIEVVKQNAEFLIKKIATRGDNQDEIHLNFVSGLWLEKGRRR